jgi:hypothetical protein
VPIVSHITTCTPAKSYSHLAKSLPAVVSEPDLYRLLTLHVPKLTSLFHCLGHNKSYNPGPRHVFIFRNKIRFYGVELLAPRPTTNLEDHPLSAIREFLINIFATTPHIGVRSSVQHLRTHHDVVTGPNCHRNSRHTSQYTRKCILYC